MSVAAGLSAASIGIVLVASLVAIGLFTSMKDAAKYVIENEGQCDSCYANSVAPPGIITFNDGHLLNRTRKHGWETVTEADYATMK